MAERLFHGGIGGLKAGDWLLPPVLTGHTTTTERLAELGADARCGPNALEPERSRRDRVYLTPHRDLATAYAAHWSHLPDWACPGLGALYVAEAENPEEDPDFAGSGVQCPRARVLAVYDPAVVWSMRKMTLAFFRHIDPGSRWRVGGIQMSPELYAALGVSSQDLRRAAARHG